MKCFVYIAIIAMFVSCASNQKSQISKLKNDSPLRSAEFHSMPRQSLTISIEGLPNTVPFEAQGAFSLIETLLDKGPKNLSEQEYNEKLFLMNAEISFSTQYRTSYLSITAPPEFLKPSLELAIQTFSNPKIDKKTIEQALRISQANLTSSFSIMRNVILYFAFKDYFDFHPMVKNGSTSPKNLKKMDYSNFKTIFNTYFHLNPLRFYTTGPMPKESVKKLIESQIPLQNYKAFSFNERALKTPKQREVTIIHRKGVTDHQVLFVYPNNISPLSQEGIYSDLVFEILGGGLSGRLGRALREEQGLTYHASASYGRYLPVWYVYSFAGNQQIKDLLKGVVNIQNDLKMGGITNKELSLAKQSLITSHRQSNELPSDRLLHEMYNDLFNYNLDYFYNYEKYIDRASLTNVELAKNKILQVDKFHLYLMGDKNILLPVLRSIGWDKVVEIINEEDI